MVLTPLKATKVSQLEECKVYGISASSLDAGASAPNMPPGGHVVYLTAEKLMVGDCLPYLQQKGPVLWVCDETHQIVRSGASFREVWTQVKQMRPPSLVTPMYNCTATATPRDMAGIIKGTGVRRPAITKTSVCRDNLHLVVEPVDGPLQNETVALGSWPRIMEIVSTRRFLVYASTQRQAVFIAQKFRTNGVSACALHGGTSGRQRIEIMANFASRRLQVILCTTPLEMGYHLPGIQGILFLGLSPGPTSLQQFAGRVARVRTAQGTAHILVPSDPLKDFKWQFEEKKSDTEREQVLTDFVLMHASLHSSGCKWRITLDHCSEIILDDCGHCSSCTSPIVTQVITDVLHALHEAFCAMQGTHSPKPLWEGSLLDLLMRKQNAKFKSDYPGHVQAVLWDVGQQCPQLTRAA